MFKNILFLGRKNCIHSKNISFFLKKNSNQVDVHFSTKLNEKFPKKFEIKNYEYIFSFRSFIILKKKHINKCKKFAINFHPGTPKYRGFGCANFAILKNEIEYGSTAHLINEKIDNGKIINVKKFLIKKNWTIDELLKTTHQKMYYQAIQLFDQILKDNNYVNYILDQKTIYHWSKKLYTKTDVDNLYSIKFNLSKKRFDKIMKATSTKKYKPYIIIHKKRFNLSDEN